jgi:hypothetical protein
LLQKSEELLLLEQCEKALLDTPPSFTVKKNLIESLFKVLYKPFYKVDIFLALAGLKYYYRYVKFLFFLFYYFISIYFI